MKKSIKTLLAVVTGSMALSTHAVTSLTVGSGWSSTDDMPPAFFWEGLNQDNAGGAYTFSAPYPVLLTITDAGLAGDQFNIFDNSAPLGSTPDTGAPDPLGASTDDRDVAFSESAYSHGTFLLPAGSHSITIQATGDSLEVGKGYLRVDAVPDSGSSAVLLAFSAMGLIWRKNRGLNSRSVQP